MRWVVKKEARVEKQSEVAREDGPGGGGGGELEKYI